MVKRKASLQQDGKNKRNKNTVIVPVQVVVPVAVADVAVADVAVADVPARSFKDEMKSLLSSIFFPLLRSDVATVAASAVSVIPAVRVTGIVNRTSDMRKLAGSEHQLIISSPKDRQGIYKFADDIVNMITTKTPYNLRRDPASLSQPWCQMMTTLRIIDVDAYYESNTVKTLIGSTNLFPNLVSITMRQPVDTVSWELDGQH